MVGGAPLGASRFIQMFLETMFELSSKSERIQEAIEKSPWNLNGVALL